MGLTKFRQTGDIQSIQLLRGVASAMVCFYHLSWGNPRFLPATSPVKQAGTWCWSGVEIFFVLSGFIIPYSMYRKNYSTGDFFIFLKKRGFRIEPPYLVSVLLVLLLNFISTLLPHYRGEPFHVDWFNTLGHIAYLNVFTGGQWLNPVYWSLAIEFQYYILIGLSFGLIVSEKISYRILFLLLFAGSSFIHLPQGAFVFGFSGYFLAGILLFQVASGIISGREFLILIFLNQCFLFYRQGWVLGLLVIGVLLIIVVVDKVPRFFSYLGLISYSLYLIHVPFAGRIINFSEVMIHGVFRRQIVVLIAFFASLGISALFYRYIERPFKGISARIFYDRAVPDKAENF